MRKYKFIALAMLLAVMLMGAGYAYWTETLTISNTVTTGDMDVVFAPAHIAGDYDGKINLRDILDDLWEAIDDGDYYNFNQAPYMTVSLEPLNDYKQLSFEITDMYPGTGGLLAFLIVNDGTVPVTLENITYDNLNDSKGLRDELNYIIHPLRAYELISNNGILNALFNELFVVNHETIHCDTFDEFITKLNGLLSGVTLKPGECIKMGDVLFEQGGYNIEMPAGITSDALEEATFSFDLQLNYKQGE